MDKTCALLAILMVACGGSSADDAGVDATMADAETIDAAVDSGAVNDGGSGALVYALDALDEIVTFSPTDPGTVSDAVAITGLAAGENVHGITLGPMGQLYAITSADRLYQVNPTTGAVTPIGAAPFATALDGTHFGIDVNPVVNRIRVVSDTEQNLRVNPLDGTVVLIDTMVSPAGNLVAASYTNARDGATSTTLYAIDSGSDSLVLIGGPDGVPSPNTGTVTLVGALGVDTGADVGFDIDGVTHVAYAALTIGSESRLYTINLASGAAALVGRIGLGDTLHSIAVLH